MMEVTCLMSAKILATAPGSASPIPQPSGYPSVALFLKNHYFSKGRCNSFSASDTISLTGFGCWCLRAEESCQAGSGAAAVRRGEARRPGAAGGGPSRSLSGPTTGQGPARPRGRRENILQKGQRGARAGV